VATNNQDFWYQLGIPANVGLGALNKSAPGDQFFGKKYKNAQAYLTGLDPSLRFLADTETANKDYGKKSGSGDAGRLEQELQNIVSHGVSFKNKSGSSEEHVKRMAADLARYGVDSLSELKAYTLPAPKGGGGTKDVFYNTRTGVIIPSTFGSSMKGEGGSYYRLQNVNGRAVAVPSWADTSEAADLAPALAVITLGAGAAFAAAGYAAMAGQAIAGATGVSAATGTALANAGFAGTLSGVTSAASGGSFGKGFLTGALGSGIGSAVSAYNPGAMITSNAAIGNTINKAISGGLSGGLGAAINSGDAGGGALRGFVQGAVSGLAGQYVGNQAAGVIGSTISKALVPVGGAVSTPAASASGSQQAPSTGATVQLDVPEKYGIQNVVIGQ
jgi:hypothetical protein